MPDITISLSDAQWTRVVAASTYIKRADETGNVDEDYLVAIFKSLMSDWVKAYEESQVTADEF
tara:strand:- start:321 stop:509 length:189 start_codon:yes stop_codon:yes gene_type:complete